MRHVTHKTIFLLFISFMLQACLGPPYDPEAVDKKLSQDPPQSLFVTQNDKKIHYVQSGNLNAKNIVIFIHGSPGDWKAYGDYVNDKTLKEKARLIAVDRLGFGQSTPDQFETSLKIHASVIAEIVKNNQNKNIIIVGHSYGGPVAVRMAVDYPNLIDGMILLAASISPALEERRWYNEAASWALIRPFLPQMWDNSNQEILPLREELIQMHPLWKNINIPVEVIHGIDDELVPIGNAAYAETQLINAATNVTTLPNQGHFLVWEQYDLVKSKILDMLQ